MLHIVHSLPGRLRLRGTSAFGNERLLKAARAEFEEIEGVESVSINIATGSIVVRYQSIELTPAAFHEALRRTGFVARVHRQNARLRERQPHCG